MYSLRNGKQVQLRLVESGDANLLFNYFQQLSPETLSRYGPHSFDKDTLQQICSTLSDEILRFIAIEKDTNRIVAYMLIKKGMIDWDEQRFTLSDRYFNAACSVTFAPSVADEFQSSGLGFLMTSFIEEELKRAGIRTIILWGGVQASNIKAVGFYQKLGYQYISSFYHNGMENWDMVKTL